MNFLSHTVSQFLNCALQPLFNGSLHRKLKRRRRRSRCDGSPMIALEALESRCLLSATKPFISISNATITETNSGTQTAVAEVSLNTASLMPVTVRYALRNRTAMAGADYRADSGTLTIPAGTIAVQLALTCYGDTIDESDEKFDVVLSFPTNALIARRVGTITILDDDTPPLISVANSNATEGSSGISSTSMLVSLSTPSGRPVTVSYRTEGVTATAGVDFQAVSGTIVIPAGQTQRTISIPILGDLNDEPNEALRIVLNHPVNAVFGKASALLTINDDDGTQLPLFQMSDLAYLGAFRVPTGQNGSSTFEFGGNAIAFNPANNSLFMASNYDAGLNIAEVKIPVALSSNGALNGMPRASVLQPFVNLSGRLTTNAGGQLRPPILGYEDLSLGGLLVAGNGLTGGMYMGYNGVELDESTNSHFRAYGLNLAALNASTFSGLVDIRASSSLPAGRVHGGYMAEVPERWRTWIGADYVTGAAGQNRIQFSSSGPALFGFDAVTPATSSGKPLVYYPFGHALQWADDDVHTPQLLFNGTTKIDGVAFVPGTRSVVFFGSNGLSAIGYGVGARFNDHTRPYQGFHSQNGNYKYQIWAYDIDDLMAVRNGTRASWGIRPTSVLNFNLPTPESSKYLGGTAFDASTGRLYISQKFAGTNATPVIHVYQLGRSPAVASDAAVAVKASGPTMTQLAALPVSIRKTLNQNTLASAMLVTVTITRRNLPGGQFAVRQQPAAKISLATVQSSASVRGHASGADAFSGVAFPELLSAARPGTAVGPLIPHPED